MLEKLEEFDICCYREYELAYELSNNRLSNSFFLHRICWNVFFKYKYEVIGDCFCLVTDDNELNAAHLVYPLGKITDKELKNIIKRWKNIFDENKKIFRIDYIDEDGYLRLKECLEEEGYSWKVKSCRDYYDYTYSKNDYIDLLGRKNKSKRHLWNEYKKNIECYSLHKINVLNISDCKKIIRKWEEKNDIQGEKLIDTDHYPMEFLWDHFDELDCQGYILYFDMKPIAFFVASIRGDYCCFHFAKSDRDYPSTRSMTVWRSYGSSLVVMTPLGLFNKT